MSRFSLPRGYAASKLNRDPLFIQNLMSHGERQAGEFLAALAFERAWADRDVAAMMALFAEEPTLVSAPPFTGQGSYQGKPQVRQFVQDQLSAGIQLDLTRKLLARERVAWTVRARGDRQETDLHGQVEAEFRSGKVATLRLGGFPVS